MTILFLLMHRFVNFCCIVGGILLVGGLYSVLWGKSKECELGPTCNEGNTELVPTCNEGNTIRCEQDDQGHNKSAGNHEVKEGTPALLAGESV
jgi:hypothetical protein